MKIKLHLFEKIIKKIALLLIKIYQLTLSLDHSPVWKHLGIRACIYHPSCSQYTYNAIEKYGVIKGSFMGGKRILRCNPFAQGGYDPVK